MHYIYAIYIYIYELYYVFGLDLGYVIKLCPKIKFGYSQSGNVMRLCS